MLQHSLTMTTPNDAAYENQPQHWNQPHLQTVTLTGNTAGASTVSGSNIVYSGGPNITLSGNGASIVWSAAAQSAQPVAISGSNGSFNFSTVTFGSSNGMHFYTTNGSVVGSYTVPTQTVQPVALSGSNGSFNFSTATFGNLNGLSFYTSNGSMVGSYTVPTQSVQPVALSGSNGSFNFSTATFGNLNGLSFYTSNGSMVGSYTVPTVPAQFSGGNSNLGNTAGDTGVVTGRLVLVGTNNITLSGSTNGGSMTISISGGAGGAGNTGSISAGTTRATLGEVVFGDANGISFGVNGQTVTASYTVPTQSVQTLGIYGVGNTTGQSSSSTYDARSLSIDGAGFISVGWSNGSLRISGTQTNPVVSNAIQSVGSATGSGTNTSRFAADDHVHAGVFSMGVSTGGNTAGNTRVDVGRFVLEGGNNITLSQATAANALNTVVISAGAGGGDTRMTAYATGNTTQSSTGTLPFSSYIFRGSGVASVGISNGSVIVDVPSGGGGGFTGGMSTEGNTAGTTGLVSNRLVLVGTGPISLSQTVNANSATLSINGPATSSLVGTSGLSVSTNGSTISVQPIPVSLFRRYGDAITAAGSIQQNSSVSICPFRIEWPVSASQMRFLASFSGATTTNNTGAGMQYSISGVIYTRNGATLSSLNSGSFSESSSYSSNATGSFNGPRILSFSLASASVFTPGEYWLALHVSTVTTGNTNLAKSVSLGVIPTWQSGFGVANYLGQGQTNTRGPQPGLAIHSTGATRASIGFTDITGHSGNSASLANLWFAMQNYTVW